MTSRDEAASPDPGPQPGAAEAAASGPAGESGPEAAGEPAPRAQQVPAAEPGEAAREAEPDRETGRRPLTRRSPFYVGFFGAVGALLAYWLGGLVLQISSTLLLIVVAMFLAVGLNAGVEFLTHRGLNRSGSVVLVIAAVVSALALFVLAVAPVISEQVTTITERAPTWLDQLQNNEAIQRFDEKYDVLQRVRDYVTAGNFGRTVFGGVVGVGAAVLSAVVNTFIIIVLTLYFLVSLPGIRRTAYRFAPATSRPRVADLGDRILASVGGYVSGAFIVALCAGLSSLVFLFIVGLGEYAVALAVVVALLDVIPMIGATLAAVVVTAIGFATDPSIGLACLVFYIVYQQVENYLIYPKVMARSVDLSGAVIVIAALTGAALLGVVGALLAIPTAAAIQLLLRELFLKRQDLR